MPELPEVETVREGLEKLIVPSHIVAVDLPYPKVITGDPKQFVDVVTDTHLIAVERRGKYLFLRLDNDWTIVSHLRMEGQYSVEPVGATPHKHTEVIFTLADNRVVFYNDTRRFGRMVLAPTGKEEQTVTALATLGPEPTQSDLTKAYLAEELQKSKQAIKAFLLNQNHVAGIGNIYADEILWLSHIHPETPANQIPAQSVSVLRDNIIAEITRATAHHGTTVHSFSNVFGEVGQFQNELKAYGRVGLPCERCGTTLVKIRVAQRGTTFCPQCQILT